MFKQTLVFTLAHLAGRIIGFLVLVLLAGNLLGARVYGVFANLDTYLMVILIASTFGTDLWLSRHAANHVVSWLDLFRMIFWRCAFSSIMLAAFALGLMNQWIGSILVGHETEMVVFFASLFFDHVALTCTAVLEGRQRLRASAAVSLVRWIVLGGVGSFLLWRDETLMALCIAFFLSSIVRAIIALVLAAKHLRLTSSLPVRFRAMIRAALPMALMNFMVVIYFHIDVLMLPEMTSAEETAWYKIAVLMVESILFISAGVATALYPLFSKTHLNLTLKIDHLHRGMRLLSVVAFPIAWGTLIVADDLIAVMFGEQAKQYHHSAVALTWLVWALPAMFINSSLVRLFLGLERQKKVLFLVTVTALLNTVLNVFFIPVWGFVGACWTTLLSEYSLFLLFSVHLRKLANGYNPVPRMAAPLFLGAAVVPIANLTQPFSLWLAIMLSAAIYAALIFGLRIVTKTDLAQFASYSETYPPAPSPADAPEPRKPDIHD